jgi:hypothetical protein
MGTKIIIITACALTLISLLLKFIRIERENISIFADIKRKSKGIMQKILVLGRSEVGENRPLKHFRLAISDWFTAAAIVTLSYLLLFKYINNEMLTKDGVFQIGLLFTLLLFNILFLAFSIIERRLGYWIDEFNTMVGHILEFKQRPDRKTVLDKRRYSARRSFPKKRPRR